MYRPIKEITSAELLIVLKKIEAQGKYEAANRARQKCEMIFRYASLNERCENNPASNLKGALISPKKKKQNSLKPSELPEFLKKLDNFNGFITTKLALKFVLLTLARTKEVRFAIWDEFDLDGKEPIWRIPEERMKMGREHLIPLSKQSLELIHKVKEFSQGERYVFHQVNNPKKAMRKHNALCHVSNGVSG